jgi:signal transduction histidine kinase
LGESPRARALSDALRFLWHFTDSGVGIPFRAIKEVFRRFSRVDRSLSRRSEGCGLGLRIAKFTVDAHQGTITVDSKPSQGSTFIVTVPAVPSA